MPRKGWKRKGTRYAWGYAAENELRKILTRYFLAVARSASSHGLVDVWAAGHKVWLFQCKRGVLTNNSALKLLVELHKNVPNENAFIYVAHKIPNRGWRFIYLTD